jgi:hypothetical protein
MAPPGEVIDSELIEQCLHCIQQLGCLDIAASCLPSDEATESAEPLTAPVPMPSNQSAQPAQPGSGVDGGESDASEDNAKPAGTAPTHMDVPLLHLTCMCHVLTRSVGQVSRDRASTQTRRPAHAGRDGEQSIKYTEKQFTRHAPPMTAGQTGSLLSCIGNNLVELQDFQVDGETPCDASVRWQLCEEEDVRAHQALLCF